MNKLTEQREIFALQVGASGRGSVEPELSALPGETLAEASNHNRWDGIDGTGDSLTVPGSHETVRHPFNSRERVYFSMLWLI
jgi:hypothetical protein